MDKILIGTIFSDVKDYVIRDWFRNVCRFTHPGFDVCAIDNSKDKKYHKKVFHSFMEHVPGSPVRSLTVNHCKVNHKQSHVFMALSSQELRAHFLAHDYDWLLYLECDVFPPLDILERLLAYKKQIISAMYFVGDKDWSQPMCGDVHHFINNKPHMYVKDFLEGYYSIDEVTSPQEVVNPGLGCILLYKDLIQQVPFRYDSTFTVHNDTTFAKDLWERDLQSLQVPIMCDHDNQPWDLQNKMLTDRN